MSLPTSELIVFGKLTFTRVCAPNEVHVSLDVDDEAPLEVEGLVVGVVVVPTSVVVGPEDGDVELGVPDAVVLAGADVSDAEFVEDVVELPHATSVSAVTTHTTSGRDLTPKVCTANPGC